MFTLGLSISYDRVLEISTDFGGSVCEQYHQDQVVCLPNLRRGLFNTSAIDNIDPNLSSTSPTDALHDTGLSLFQHPSHQNYGHNRARSEHPTLEEKNPQPRHGQRFHRCTSLYLHCHCQEKTLQSPELMVQSRVMARLSTKHCRKR